MTDKEKQAIALVRKGMDIGKAARAANVSSYWLSLKTGGKL